MSLTSMLNDTCTISTVNFSQNTATGGATNAMSGGSTLRCSVQADGSYEALMAQRLTGQTQFKVFFPYGTTVRPEDRITWRGRTLAVISSGVDGAGRFIYTMVRAQETIGGGGT